MYEAIFLVIGLLIVTIYACVVAASDDDNRDGRD